MSASKLNAKDRKELEQLPARIEKLEAEQNALADQIGAPNFYQRDKATIDKVQKRAAAVADELALLYERWEALEALR